MHLPALTWRDNIVEFNNSFRELLGYSAEELYKLTYKDLTPEKWHSVEAKIIADQIMKRGYSDVYEKEYITKAGSCNSNRSAYVFNQK